MNWASRISARQATVAGLIVSLVLSAAGLMSGVGLASGALIHAVTGTGTPGFTGDGNSATDALLNFPSGSAQDHDGNIYIADTANSRIRVVNVSPTTIVVAGLTIAPGNIGTVAGNGTAGFNGDNVAASDAELNSPSAVALDILGNIYIADTGNSRVRVVNVSSTDTLTVAGVSILPGQIGTVAGSGSAGFDIDGVAANSAELNMPSGIVLDGTGNIYITDSGNSRLRVVNVSSSNNLTLAGVTIAPCNIGTVAGSGTAGFDNDGVAARDAELDNPLGVALDGLGNIYIADTGNSRIRVVNVGSTQSLSVGGNSISPGNIGTVAGTGGFGYDQDGVAASGTRLNSPSGVAIDTFNNIYIADSANSRVREVNANGIISTIAGTGIPGYNGDEIPASSAQLGGPVGLSLDARSNIYVADSGASRVRKIDALAGLPATHFSVNITTSPIIAGSPVAVTVTAVDQNGNPANGYAGTIHFTSSDPAAVLPLDSALTIDGETFQVTFETGGIQTVTITDSSDGSIIGVSNSISVSASPKLSGATGTTFTAGTAGSIQIAATGYPAPSLTISPSPPSGITFVDHGDGTGTLAGNPVQGTGNVYNLTVRATNGTGSDSESFTLTVNEAPSITSPSMASFTVGLAGSFSVTASGYPAPQFSSTGSLPSGLSLNNSGVLSGTPAAGTVGSSSVMVTASNPVGSTSTPLTVNVTQPPAASIGTLAGTLQTASINTSFSSQFQASVLDTYGHPVAGVLVTFSAPVNGPSGSFAEGLNTATTNVQGIATASWFTANGITGNYSVNASVSGVTGQAVFSLTNVQSPSFTGPFSASFTTGISQSIPVAISGFPTSTVTMIGGTLPSGISFNGTSFVGTPAAGSGGAYSVLLKASNGIASDATQMFTISVFQPPVFSSAGMATFTTGIPGSFQLAASGFPSPSFSIRSGTLPSGMGLNNGVISGTPGASTGGNYPLSLSATNGFAPDATQPFTLSVLQPPAFSSPPVATFSTGMQGSFSAVATGFPAPVFTLTNGTLPGGLTFNGGVISGIPPAGTGGTYSFTLTASNGVGLDASQRFSLTVDQPAFFTSANSITSTVGMALSLPVTVTGFPAVSVSIVAGTLPTGISFNGSAFAGTPALGSGGRYVVSLKAANGVTPDAMQDFTFTILQPPSFLNAPTTTFTTGISGSFGLAASGFPSPSFALISGSLPSGVGFNNGVLAGTPAPGSGGTYNLSFAASNGVSPDAPEPFTLIVDQAAAFTSAGSAIFMIGVPQSFSVTASGFPAATITVTTGTLPGGITFNGTAFVGTPAAGTYGTYNVVLGATNGLASGTTQSFALTILQPPVLREGADNYGTSNYPNESQLTASNVSAATFGRLFSVPVDGSIYAQPLYLPSQQIAGGTHDVVYVATMNDVVYAFDANSAGPPLWKTDLRNAPSITEVTSTDGNIADSIGIESTPVIDQGTGVMFVVTYTKENGFFFYRLHALSLFDGSEKLGGPVAINGTVGSVVFDASQQMQRPGLAVSNGRVFVAFGSFGDTLTYHAWVMAYGETQGLPQVAVTCLTPTGTEGSIWQSGRAPVVDSAGNLYYAVANGSFDGAQNYAESLVKLSSQDLSVLDYFASFDEATQSEDDHDLNMLIGIPDAGAILVGGKTANSYLTSLTTLGHSVLNNTQILQTLASGQLFTTPAYANDVLYYWPSRGNLTAMHFNGTNFDPVPVSTGNVLPQLHSFAASLAVSSNAGAPGTSIVWASMPSAAGENTGGVISGIVRAYDANNLTKELWNSGSNSGLWSKFRAPVIEKGKVYVGSVTDMDHQVGAQLTVYGLLSTGGSSSNAATFVSRDATTQGNWVGTYGLDGYDIANSLNSTPSYAALSISSQYGTYTWVPSTSDPRALSTGASRIASTWYGATTSTIADITVSGTHVVSLYLVDWDSQGRAEMVQTVDGTTGALLDSQTVTSFSNGIWLTWNITGHIKFVITQSSGPNCVISGVFFGKGNTGSAEVVAVSPGTANVAAGGQQQFTAAVTNGASQTVSWSISSVLPSGAAGGALSSTTPGLYLAPATVTQATSVTITATAADGKAAGTSTITLAPENVTVSPATVSVAAGGQQQFSASVTNGTNQAVTWSISSVSPTSAAGGMFSTTTAGLYVAPASVTQMTTVIITATAGDGKASGTSTVTLMPTVTGSGATASYLGSDTTTEGNWQAKYGGDGYDLANGTQSPTSGQLPYGSYAVHNPSSWTWATSTSDVRALQDAHGGRLAATWYGAPGFSMDVNFTDGNTHEVALYLIDWDSRGRTETVQITDANNPSTVLDSRLIAGGNTVTTSANFMNGTYLTWNISGHVTITTTLTAGPNAVISGMFFGNTGVESVVVSPATASVAGGGQQQFTATVTNGANQTVSWSISSVLPSGVAGGAFSSTTPGLYLAPGTVTQATSVTITATAADGKAAGTSTITLAPENVTVSPGTANVAAGGQQQFTAAVTNGASQTVNWSISSVLPSGAAGGAFSSTTPGLYLAPGTVTQATSVTITATAADGKATGTSTITLAPVSGTESVTVSPGTASLASGGQQQFSVSVTNGTSQAVTWMISSVSPASAAGGAFSTTTAGLYLAPASVTQMTTVIITATAADGMASGTSTVTLMPTVTGGGPTVSYLGSDTTTQGNWQGKYGGDGYDLANGTQSPTNGLLPYGSYTVHNPSSWTWATSTSDVRALQDGHGGRLAATWYGAPGFSIDVNFTDGNTHEVALYLIDWDSKGRTETVQVTDANNPNTVLDTRTIAGGNTATTSANFMNGTYLTWNISGHVTITATLTAGPNAVISGLFFGGGALQAPAITSVSNTTFTVGTLGTFAVTTTGVPVPAITCTGTLPPGVTFTDNGNGTAKFTGIATDNSASPYSLSLSASNGIGTSAQQSFKLTVNPAAVGGPTASFVKYDTSTQGSWIGTYGSQGYSIANGAQSSPTYATFSVQNQISYTWVPVTSDMRALQNGVGRIASAWYNPQSFSIDVNISDGNTHAVAVYLMDWDSKGRSQTLQIVDANNLSTVLDSRVIPSGSINATNFTNGIYVVWNVSGHVTIKITDNNGPNGVVSGIFFQ